MTEETGGALTPELVIESGQGTKFVDVHAATDHYETKIALLQREHELDLVMATAAAKVKGTAVQENFARLTRVMLLRRTKEQLKPLGQWSKWCEQNGLVVKHCDDEIDKLGDFGDEVLLKIGDYYGYHLNKIKYLTSGDLRNSEVVAEKGKLVVDGNEIDMTPDEIKLVIDARDDRLRKQEEKSAKDAAEAEKAHKETQKALKKAERELKKIKGDAEKAGVSPEELAFLQEMDAIRAEFDALFARMKPEFAAVLADEGKASLRTAAAYKALLNYMYNQIDAAGVNAGGN